jgi:hypothetical protein
MTGTNVGGGEAPANRGPGSAGRAELGAPQAEAAKRGGRPRQARRGFSAQCEFLDIPCRDAHNRIICTHSPLRTAAVLRRSYSAGAVRNYGSEFAVRTLSSRVARRHPGAESPARLSSPAQSPASSWPLCGQSERRKSPSQPCLIRLAAAGMLNRITLACARAAIRLPVRSFRCSAVREHGAGARLRAPRAENADPANCPERCSDGYSPPPPPWWPGKLAPWPVQRAGASRSSGVPDRDNPCCPVPTFHSYTDGQMTVRRS